MKKYGMWLIGAIMMSAGCGTTTHKSLQSDTTITATSTCQPDKLVWRGLLTEDQSVLSLCVTPYGYVLHRQYVGGKVVSVNARDKDVGLEEGTVNGGFWLRAGAFRHCVMEGTETAIYEIDKKVPYQEYLPQFVSSVATLESQHVNRTKTHF